MFLFTGTNFTVNERTSKVDLSAVERQLAKSAIAAKLTTRKLSVVPMPCTLPLIIIQILIFSNSGAGRFNSAQASVVSTIEITG